MTSRLRPRVILAVLAAALLLSFVVPTVDARVPRATRYRVGGPITLDTNLLSKSGVSAWAIDEYLEATTSLPRLGRAFIGAEKKYGVNARFLLAAALHESGWGSSYISRVKHNLFGLNAYDRDPLHHATAFATYAASIDATAEFIKDSYLTPGGRWWGGQPTLRSMQQFWSSSHRWGVGVSRIATSIHLDTISRRSITFAAPVVSDTLHGGSKASVRLTWSGGAIPAGIEFVASWEPIELDAEILGATSSPAVTGVAARRTRTKTRSITLAMATPPDPGTYLLEVEMRDSGRRPLPAADQVDIPGVEVRVWGDRAVSYDFQPSVDGTGAVLRVTNTGREAIPAVLSQVQPEPRDPEAQASRSVVTVTASAGDRVDPDPVLLIAAPLVADLLPGDSVSFDMPAIKAATGRATNWLSISLSVLGDASWLSAHAPVGAWFSDAGLSAPGSMGAVSQAGAGAPGSPTTVAPVATPAATARSERAAQHPRQRPQRRPQRRAAQHPRQRPQRRPQRRAAQHPRQRPQRRPQRRAAQHPRQRPQRRPQRRAAQHPRQRPQRRPSQFGRRPRRRPPRESHGPTRSTAARSPIAAAGATRRAAATRAARSPGRRPPARRRRSPSPAHP